MSPEAQVWRRKALEREAALDLPGALDAYQQALTIEPSSLEIAGALAALAFRLNDWDMAEKFYAHLITHGRQDIATLTAYAACLREQGRYDEAIDLLKSLAQQHAGEAALWNALGTTIAAKGDHATAVIFFDEALRLAPHDLHARFHRGCARIDLGDPAASLADLTVCAERFRDPDNRASAAFTCAQAALAIGDLEAGWRWYEARHKQGTVHEVQYALDLPRWRGENLQGKRLFVSAEQGLGDEILFASLLPDIVHEVAGLGIGVEPRLVPLFHRSFPGATVIAHHTESRDGRRRRDFPGLDDRSFDTWALMGDFLASRRSKIDDFPTRSSFLIPDAARVAYWRDYLTALGPAPKVGLLWKSLKTAGLRVQSFSPFSQWRSVLETPGVQFINLQYGDTAAELAEAAATGISLHTPQGIDLKQDLDDLAALTFALDLVLGPSNATSNIAAACGVPVWVLTTPIAWHKLGQSNYPWYPGVRTFAPPALGDWAPAMAEIKSALTALSAP